MVFFDKVALAPPDPILGLSSAFLADPRTVKVNLGAGIYKDEALKTPIMRAVKQAEAQLLQGEKNKEYLPIEGDRLYIEQMGQMVFGADFWSQESSRICGFQTPGGTGALRVGAAFLKKELNSPVFIPSPTWPNHRGVFLASGFSVDHYPYYDFKNHTLEFEKVLSFLKTLAPKSVLILHASCHNPTGVDFTAEQWKLIADVCVLRQLLPFFDCAYQGFGKGIDEDVQAVRMFAAQGIEMMVAVSQSKNFSLYGERVGALYVLSSSAQINENVRSGVKIVIRTLYSNPPMHGAKVVGTILQDLVLKASWLEELEEMRNRIDSMRKEFVQALLPNVLERDLSYMEKGHGMFCFTGLNKHQVEKITKDFGIYMTMDGRINICGLTVKNIPYVVEALTAVIHEGGD